MAAEVIMMRDFDRERIAVRRDEPATIIILPIIRIERFDADPPEEEKPPRGGRRAR